MSKVLENVAAAEVSKKLAEAGVAPDEPVSVYVGREESLADVADLIRKEAQARGMTNEIFEELMKDLR